MVGGVSLKPNPLKIVSSLPKIYIHTLSALTKLSDTTIFSQIQLKYFDLYLELNTVFWWKHIFCVYGPLPLCHQGAFNP